MKEDVDWPTPVVGAREPAEQPPEAAPGDEGSASDARARIQAYQQHLRAGLLVSSAADQSSKIGWRAALTALHNAWGAVWRALP